MLQSKDEKFNQVKAFHDFMNDQTPNEVTMMGIEQMNHRIDFKIEELVEIVHATACNDDIFDESIAKMQTAIQKAATKVRKKKDYEENGTLNQLAAQVDGLIDLLYFTYGTFALMGIDPDELFHIVHRANMAKKFPDGKARFDPITNKILKPQNWEVDFAPEQHIVTNLQQQLNRSEKI